jgi:phosphoribosylglycinamide formyltransferase-1
VAAPAHPHPPEDLTSPARLVVLVSGTGSNLAALLEACADSAYGASVVAVGADRDGITALDKAKAAEVPTFVVPFSDYDDRDEWDQALVDAVSTHTPDLVVSAGFMRLVGKRFLERFTMVNTHPALLPSFPGTHAVRDALAYGVRVTGCTVHFVDAGVDTGPVIAQRAVPVLDGDDEARLHERIKVAERLLLVESIGRLARDGYRLDARTVVLP